MKRIQKGKRGAFTLVETMLAIFVVVISALMISAAMPISTVSRGRADLLNKASGISQKELEAVRTEGFANCNPTQLSSLGLIDSSAPVATNTYTFTNTDVAANDSVAKVLPQGTAQLQLINVSTSLTQVISTIKYYDNTVNAFKTVTTGTLVANI